MLPLPLMPCRAPPHAWQTCAMCCTASGLPWQLPRSRAAKAARPRRSVRASGSTSLTRALSHLATVLPTFGAFPCLSAVPLVPGQGALALSLLYLVKGPQCCPSRTWSRPPILLMQAFPSSSLCVTHARQASCPLAAGTACPRRQHASASSATSWATSEGSGPGLVHSNHLAAAVRGGLSLPPLLHPSARAA